MFTSPEEEQTDKDIYLWCLAESVCDDLNLSDAQLAMFIHEQEKDENNIFDLEGDLL